MTYQQAQANAKGQVGPYCKSCPVCNGFGCGNAIPGPGAKGTGSGFIANYKAWQSICVNMDTICESKPIDTTATLFGQSLALPVLAGPLGGLPVHYGDKFDDLAYNHILIPACKEAGILACTGDCLDPSVMEATAQALSTHGGMGIPTIKPWDMGTVAKKLDMVNQANPVAIAMDIDAAGLPFLKNQNPPAGSKTVEELKEIVKLAQKPFILKGIMTVKGALKALEAGASAIVVSNHGGRVLDNCPATATVLPDIVAAVGGKMTILVDGGIRTGMDVFKALALGADGVLIGRPFINMIYGNGAEGVAVYVQTLQAELADTMAMCGAHTLAEITPEMIQRSNGAEK